MLLCGDNIAAKIAVAGLSSGAFMAVQMHVAYSAVFILFKEGVGSFAGVPFYCAEGSIGNAFPRCMCGSDYMPLSVCGIAILMESFVY